MRTTTPTVAAPGQERPAPSGEAMTRRAVTTITAAVLAGRRPARRSRARPAGISCAASRADFVNISLSNITVILDHPTLPPYRHFTKFPDGGKGSDHVDEKTAGGGDGVGGTTAPSGLVIAVAIFMSGTATALVHQVVAATARPPLPVFYPAHTASCVTS
jgi:hypothetical protein